jgi:hypothetical protein
MFLTPDGRFKVEVISTLDHGQSITISEWGSQAEVWIIREKDIRPPKYGVSDEIRQTYVCTILNRYFDPTTLIEYPNPDWEHDAYRATD